MEDASAYLPLLSMEESGDYRMLVGVLQSHLGESNLNGSRL